MSDRSYLSIGDVLALLQEEFPDVTISKIRFLESRGLLVPERTPSGYRKFYEHDVERLRWILRQQRENFLPLKVIKGRLEGQLPPAEPAALFEVGDRSALGPPPNGSTDSVNAPVEHEEAERDDAREGVAVHATVGAPLLAAADEARSTAMPGAATEGRETAAVTAKEAASEETGERLRQPVSVAHAGVPTRSGPSADRRDSAMASSVPPMAAPVQRPSPALQSAPGTVIPRPSSAGSVPPVATAVAAERPGAGAGVAGAARRVGGPGAGAAIDAQGASASAAAATVRSQASDPAPGGAPAGRPGGGAASGPAGTAAGSTAPASSPAAKVGPAGGSGGGAPAPAGATSAGEATAPRAEASIGSPTSPAPAGAATAGASPPAGSAGGGPERAAGIADELAGANLTAAELAQATGLTVAAVEELESYGLIESRPVAGVACYDEAAVVIAGLAANFAKFGIEARHLRIFKHAAERQASLYSQIVMPLLRQRNPVARRRAGEDLNRLTELGASMQECFVKALQRDLTGG